ncbi:MAG: hypothetical protein ABT940_06875 [Alphaproteobacteria bacterium]
MRLATAAVGAFLWFAYTAGPCFAEDEAEEESSESIFDSIPPIGLTGNLSYTVGQTRTPRGDTTLNSVTTLSASPNTYIYEPWLATVYGTLNASLTSQSSMTPAPTNGVGQAKTSLSESDLLTGSVGFNVLSQSDYPIDLYYGKYSSTVLADDLGRDTTGQTMRISGTQKIMDDLSSRMILQLDNSVDGTGAGENSSEIDTEVDKRFDEDYVRVGVNHRGSVYSGGLQGTATADVNSGTLRYRSQPFDTVTTDSMSTLRFSDTMDQTSTGSSAVMQGVTTAMWKPEFVQDMIVHGAFRSFQDQVHTAKMQKDGQIVTDDSSSRSAFGTMTTNYPLAQRLYLNLGLNSGLITRERKSSQATVATTSGSANTGNSELTLSAGTSASLSYTSLNTDWEGFNWIWNAGGGGTMSATTLGPEQSENLNAGHSLSRPIDLPFLGPANLNLGQGAAINYSTTASLPINHSAGLNQGSRDGKTWSTWSTTISDSRAVGGDGSTYQIMNSQLTKGYDPDRFSSWSANVSYQAYRQSSQALVAAEAAQAVDTRDTLTGNVSYRSKDIFGIEGVTYTSELSLNPPSIIAQNRARDFGTSTAPPPSGFGSQRWNNRLDYMIGQLRTSGMARTDNGPEGMGMIFLFQVARRF